MSKTCPQIDLIDNEMVVETVRDRKRRRETERETKRDGGHFWVDVEASFYKLPFASGKECDTALYK